MRISHLDPDSFALHHSEFDIDICQIRLHVVLIQTSKAERLIHRCMLGYELSKESADVVEVVEQEEDGEADGEAEDDGECDQDFPQML